MVPRVLQAKKSRAVLLHAVEQLFTASAHDSFLFLKEFLRTKNHMEAPRPVAKKRYIGRAGWT